MTACGGIVNLQCLKVKRGARFCGCIAGFWLQDFICPPREDVVGTNSEIFSVYLGHARARDKFLAAF